MPVIVTADDGSQSSSQHAVKCLYCDALDSAHAQNHETEEIPAVPATCTEPGKTAGEQCTTCKYVTKEPEVEEALGHAFGGPEIVTTAADGEELTLDNTKAVRKCSRPDCGEEEEATLVSIAKDAEKSQAATCEEDGKDVYNIEMSYDGKTVSEQYDVTVKALGHNIVEVPAKDANCYQDGNRAYFKCDREYSEEESCDKYFREATAEELEVGEGIIDEKYVELDAKYVTGETDKYYNEEENPNGVVLKATEKHTWSKVTDTKWDEETGKVTFSVNCTVAGCPKATPTTVDADYKVITTATCTDAGKEHKEAWYNWDPSTGILLGEKQNNDKDVCVKTDEVNAPALGHKVDTSAGFEYKEGKYSTEDTCERCSEPLVVNSIEEAFAYATEDAEITVTVADGETLTLDKDLTIPVGAKLAFESTSNLAIGNHSIFVEGTLDLTNAEDVTGTGTIQKVNEGTITDPSQKITGDLTQEATINSEAEDAVEDLKTALTGDASAVNVETNIDLDKEDVIEITSGEKTLNLSDDVVITNSNNTTNGIKVNGDDAKLTIKGGTFKATDRSRADAAPLNVNGKGQLTLENVKVDNSGTDQYGVTVLGNEAKLTMTGGSIITENRACISTNGAQTPGAQIELTGVTLTCNGTGDEAVAMYLPGKADVKLTECTITGSTGIEMLRGTLEIDDKTTVTGTKQAITSNEGINFNETRSGAINVGGAIVVAVDENYVGEGSSEEIKVTLASTTNISDIIVLESTDTNTDRTVTIVSPDAAIKGTKIGKSSMSKVSIKTVAPEV